MIRLASQEWEKINGYLVRLYRELDTEKHIRLMLQLLNELVPVDSAGLNLFTPPNQLSAITFPEGYFTKKDVSLVAKYAPQSPYGAYYVATQDASWKMTTDFMPIEDFQKLDLYRHALAPKGVNYQIGGMLAMIESAGHILTLHRTHQPFTEEERVLLNTIHPHLVTSYLNAKSINRANRSITELKAVMETAPGAYGYFNADMTLAWLQPRAQEWLLEFFPNEVKSSGNIPRSIDALVKQSCEEDGAPKSSTKAGGKEILIVLLSQSSLGGWILRLERKTKTHRPHFCPLSQLTPRENDVLRWMMEGKRNREIAVILNTSERTVEKQVQSILAKLEAENRATAILRAMELAATINMQCECI